jgi:mannose-6-phosphate isomerase-like protein (cupin superfamily)
MAVEIDERAGSAFKTFQVRPQLLESGKKVTMLAKTDILSCGVQVVASGGETNLHAHMADDAIWLVLGGRARFYTTDDALVAELGKNEALLIPRGEPYWFESASDENLVIMRIAAKDKNTPDTRQDVGQRQFAVMGAEGGVQREVQYKDKFFGDE